MTNKIVINVNAPAIIMQYVHYLVKYKTKPPVFQITPIKIVKNYIQLNH
jgi:hypothetical protein